MVQRISFHTRAINSTSSYPIHIFTNHHSTIKHLCFYSLPIHNTYNDILSSLISLSPTQLHYEKLVYNNIEDIEQDDQEPLFWMSDIHYEIDFSSFAGTKKGWQTTINRLYQIHNSSKFIVPRCEKFAFVICRHTDKMNHDLSDIFSQYIIQNPFISNSNLFTPLTFIFITNNISILQPSIIQECNIVYSHSYSTSIYHSYHIVQQKELEVTNKWLTLISQLNKHKKNADLLSIKIRDCLYDCIIYQISIERILWNFILKNLIHSSSFPFILQYFELNQQSPRTIYHLEILFYKLYTLIQV